MTSTVATPTSPLDYVRSMTDEEKDAALIELVEEAIRRHGDRYTIPLRKPNGELLAYFVPSGAAEASLRVRIPEQTPEQLAEVQAAIADPDNTFDPEEFFDELSRQDRD